MADEYGSPSKTSGDLGREIFSHQATGGVSAIEAHR
jgi:hypothetical protein